MPPRSPASTVMGRLCAMTPKPTKNAPGAKPSAHSRFALNRLPISRPSTSKSGPRPFCGGAFFGYARPRPVKVAIKNPMIFPLRRAPGAARIFHCILLFMIQRPPRFFQPKGRKGNE